MNRTATALTMMLLLAIPAIAPAEKRCPISIFDTAGKQVRLSVEIADNEAKREKGLMFRQSLDENSGMLFVFPDTDYRNFWMKNTLIPLSIAYIGPNCIISQILDMEPLDISVTYPSSHPARYALEVSRGWFTKNRIKPGCRVMLHGCLGQ